LHKACIFIRFSLKSTEFLNQAFHHKLVHTINHSQHLVFPFANRNVVIPECGRFTCTLYNVDNTNN